MSSHMIALNERFSDADLLEDEENNSYSEFAIEIIRQFVHSEDQMQQLACLEYIRETSLVFRKMNIATLAAAFGSH